jgi:hypothetical protein
VVIFLPTPGVAERPIGSPIAMAPPSSFTFVVTMPRYPTVASLAPYVSGALPTKAVLLDTTPITKVFGIPFV